jgi:hypothetical protein
LQPKKETSKGPDAAEAAVAAAILPETAIRAWLRYAHGQVIQSVADIGHNKITLPTFCRLIADGRWHVEALQLNRKRGSRLMGVLNSLRTIPIFERFCTVGVYAVLTRG